MNYADIKCPDVANGKGVRVSLFVSGCTHHCPGCFNEATWDFKYGSPFTEREQEKILGFLGRSYISGLSLLGGEPFEHVNQQGLLPLLREVRRLYPLKSVWCYTGYDYEKDILGSMLCKWAETKELLSYIDILVDGRFVEALKSPSLQFKGSSNQRIIDVRASRRSGQVVLWQDDGYIDVKVAENRLPG